MPKTTQKLYLKYFSFVNLITKKRINTLIPISLFLLILLMFFDVYITKNTVAPYTRLLPISIGIILLVLRNTKIKITNNILTLIYNVFMSSILIMMLIKFNILFNSDYKYSNPVGIIIAIFIMSLEVRANLINSLIIYLLPFSIFVIHFYLKYSLFYTVDLSISFVNVVIFLIIGFFVNQVQNKYRLNLFKANYSLELEKIKLEHSNEELKVYQERLSDLVEKKTVSLQNALKKAKESDKLKTAFLRNVSHEIRTPINAVSGFLELLSNKDKGIEKEFKIINDNFEVLTNTIDNIIFLSKLEAEEKKFIPSKFQLAEFVNTSFEILKSKIILAEKNISSILEFNKYDNVIINSNKDYLEKVLILIFDNAVKFTDFGEIIFKCYKKNSNIFFEIKDTGSGISKKDLKNIFKTFSKFENKNNIFRGVGVGMSIVKKLVTILNGEIKIFSTQGLGTIIEIKIPQK